MKLKCKSVSKEIWGNGSGNTDDLEVGKEYVIVERDIHSWHTLYTLDGVLGTFNSCLFEDAPEEE